MIKSVSNSKPRKVSQKSNQGWDLRSSNRFLKIVRKGLVHLTEAKRGKRKERLDAKGKSARGGGDSSSIHLQNRGVKYYVLDTKYGDGWMIDVS